MYLWYGDQSTRVRGKLNSRWMMEAVIGSSAARLEFLRGDRNVGRRKNFMKVYAFDVDETLYLSHGPVQWEALVALRADRRLLAQMQDSEEEAKSAIEDGH